MAILSASTLARKLLWASVGVAVPLSKEADLPDAGDRYIRRAVAWSSARSDNARDRAFGKEWTILDIPSSIGEDQYEEADLRCCRVHFRCNRACSGKASAAVAERQYLDAASGSGDIYNVMVTFTGKKPASAKVESVLRECIAAAIKKDASKDILATAWLKRRVGASDDDDERINRSAV
jgi:hypothetical protein